MQGWYMLARISKLRYWEWHWEEKHCVGTFHFNYSQMAGKGTTLQQFHGLVSRLT